MYWLAGLNLSIMLRYSHSLLKPLVECQRHIILLLQSSHCWIHLGADCVQIHIHFLQQPKELLHTAHKRINVRDETASQCQQNLKGVWLTERENTIISTYPMPNYTYNLLWYYLLQIHGFLDLCKGKTGNLQVCHSHKQTSSPKSFLRVLCWQREKEIIKNYCRNLCNTSL